LLGIVNQDIILTANPTEVRHHADGITDADVYREGDRLDRRTPSTAVKGIARTGGGKQLNVGPDERFDTIHQIVPMPFDPQAHAALARQVSHHARRFRRHLQDLGLGRRTQRHRLRGYRLDRARLPSLVAHGDPRILIAREWAVETDLFLGVLIDCSGSMQGKKIEQARLFGTLLAEAAKGLPGVALRLFGFTDSQIYDANDARRPAVHGLTASGGNNDAAALWHAAQQAIASRAKARLLVMISDGLPTECTVAALRALVARLTRRWNLCCAQVAVESLTEVCFPHYVVLEEDDLDLSVRRFGTIVARLVRKALARG
jgi:nitric oxide reductase activation protein